VDKDNTYKAHIEFLK